MKILMILITLWSLGTLAQTVKKLPEKKPLANPSKAVKKVTSKIENKVPIARKSNKQAIKSEDAKVKVGENPKPARTPVKDDGRIEKTPKAIFLIKRAKVDADIGEPVLYPFDRQLSNLYYDLPNGEIKNE